MVVSRATAEGVGDELRRLFGALEQELAAGAAKRLKAGIDRPDWAEKKLAAAGELRRWTEGLVKRTTGRGARDARAAVEDAFNRGGQAAERALAGRRFRRPRQLAAVRQAIPGADNINALAASLGGRLEATGPQVVRSVLDAYRQTVTAGAATILGGATARRDAAQSVWNKLLDQGFTGFTDARGRRWSLAGYVDMATRTTTAQAAVQGQLDRQAEQGLDLVIVSNAPQECERCRPWEGKVLTRDESGRGGRAIQAEHAIDDRMITVHVAGSVAEAIAAGLLHPNCRHSLSAYLPGLTTAPTHTADPLGNAARTRLRELERRARAARLQEAGALDPAGKKAAAARLRATQAEIKQHVEDTRHLGIKRKPERERLDLGNVRSDGSAPPAPAPPAAAAPPALPTQAYRARQDDLLGSYRGGIQSERQLGGGDMARTDRVRASDGTELVRKRSLGYTGRDPAIEQDAEELGALVVRFVGGRAPTVARMSDDVVLMDFIDGRALVELNKEERAALRHSEQVRQINLADIMMGNVDRNGGNALLDAEGRLHAIDHGSAFDWHPEYNPPDRIVRVRNIYDNFFAGPGDTQEPGDEQQQYSLEEIRALQDQIGVLADEFDRLGHRPWFEAMGKRLRVLAELAKRKE
jgi:hypothetical protein